ncbi:MAG: hypothetical protein Q7S37_04370 [bacterium]|nr:hypothetical protein [bacterium]
MINQNGPYSDLPTQLVRSYLWIKGCRLPEWITIPQRSNPCCNGNNYGHTNLTAASNGGIKPLNRAYCPICGAIYSRSGKTIQIHNPNGTGTKIKIQVFVPTGRSAADRAG